MDSVFGPENFRNEIIWKRTSAHSSAKRYGPVHDTLLFFSKSDTYTWNPQPRKLAPEDVAGHDVMTDEEGAPLSVVRPDRCRHTKR